MKTQNGMATGMGAGIAIGLSMGLALGAGVHNRRSSTSSVSATAAPQPALPAAEFHSVEAFLQTLPVAQTPPLNETEAMALAAYPLSCLDHLQGQGGSGGPAANASSSGGRGRGAATTAVGTGNPPAAPTTAAPAGRGAYLWESAGPTHLLAGYDRERSFYGCYDWHSAVNSTWTLVTLLRRYPKLPIAELMREKLNDHLGARNLQGEMAFFQGAHTFEQPYGQAWLLKLYGDLLSWDDPDAKKWAANMAPLAQFFSENLTKYFTHLPTPIRQGVHPNTAFDMDLLLPYTEAAHDTALRTAVEATAHRLYAQDEDCPTGYEPEGVSFLSPCLVEGALMAHLLPAAQFQTWYGGFMPAEYARAFHPLVSPFDASQMTPEQMAGQSHLIGLAFSRAAAMLAISQALPANDPRAAVLRRLAAIHAVKGYQTMDKAGYLETHWIASYALMYELAAAPTPAPRAAAAATEP